MDSLLKIPVILVALYLGGVTGFFCGYLANASLLRGYREETEEMRNQLEMGLPEAKDLWMPARAPELRGR